MAELSALTPRGRRILLAAVLLYAVVTIPLAVHKGEDIASEFAQSDLLLRGLPVYLTPQNQGVWWPPFALLSIAPFALIAHLSLPLAKGCWAAFSVLCLAWSLWRTQRFGGRAMVFALLAVALPIQYNFQHLNINTPLLALAIATADDLEHHEARAGAWTAAATALKLFPALLILLFAFRRKWRAFGVASAGALLLTYASMLPYGLIGAGQAVVRWVRLDLDLRVKGVREGEREQRADPGASHRRANYVGPLKPANLPKRLIHLNLSVLWSAPGDQLPLLRPR